MDSLSHYFGSRPEPDYRMIAIIITPTIKENPEEHVRKKYHNNLLDMALENLGFKDGKKQVLPPGNSIDIMYHFTSTDYDAEKALEKLKCLSTMGYEVSAVHKMY